MGNYPEAYVFFLVHFHGTRDYFECHELLEEYWKRESDPALRPVWHGLIQVAVSAYHERRGNLKGALKMLEQAITRLSAADAALAGLGREELRRMLLERRGRLLSGLDGGDTGTYADPELPIADPELLAECKTLCAGWGYPWNRPSPLEDGELLHRHTRRDRTDVIEERMRSLAGRGARSGTGRTDA